MKVESCTDHVNNLADMHKWKWSETTREQLRLLSNPEEFANVRNNQFATTAITGAELLWETTLSILGEDLQHKMPEYFACGVAAVRLLVDEDLHAAMVDVYSSWQKVLEAESLAHQDQNVKKFMDQIVHLRFPVVRLFFCLLEEDLRVGQSNRSVEFARAITVLLPDRKVPEDLHQRVRNYQKLRRSRYVSKAAVYGRPKCLRIGA